MNTKQGLLIIMDGLGDRPIAKLRGMTPLEAADTPNFDRFAAEGMCGNVYPISPGKPVGTDVGHLHIFGYDSREIYTGRGPIEAASAGIDIIAGDIAFRGNFGTIDAGGTVIDRRAGRICENTAELAKALDGMEPMSGVKVLAKALTEHRIAIVLRGERLSDQISCTDPGTAKEGNPLKKPAPLDGTPEAASTAEVLQAFTDRAYEILKDHHVNKEREAKGLPPANIVITRGAGKKMHIPSMKSLYNIKAACIAGDQTIGGIAKLVGMDYYTSPAFTGSFFTDYIGKARLALRLLQEGYDWVVIHIKGTDLAGHDNLPEKKKAIIEQVDKMAGFLLAEPEMAHRIFALTADHSTPCATRDHSGDGVPSFIAGAGVSRDSVQAAGEASFMKGALQNLTANDFFMLQMDQMGFSRKIGS